MKTILDWNVYEDTARKTIAEGCVLLENNGVLPLKKDSTVSVFGRIQTNYYKSGTGSGGKVNVAKVWNIVEGLEESGFVKVNQELKKVYEDWEKENPYDEGMGWGKERWSQDEMPLTKELVSEAATASDVAIVIIGRTAGEDKDNSATKGSYFLTDEELDMLKMVRAGFDKVAVLLNVGNIIDMGFVQEVKPDAVMYVWQGGMLGGLGTADVLTGKIAPCGKLTDTIAKSITDYPSDKWFGDLKENFYCEDIFTGYRYFETFAKDKVLYPFGYGLTYSNFKIETVNASNDLASKQITLKVKVTNTGTTAGKEVVQIYIGAPNGKLGKASRVLVDFEKTELLQSGASQEIDFTIPYYNFASYDDGGYTGNKACFVLEEGSYTVFAGSDVRSATEAFKFDLCELLVIKKCEEAYAPVRAFERMHANADGSLTMQAVPLSTVDMWQRRKERLPKEIPFTGDKGYKLKDVLDGKITIQDFVAQFTDEELACFTRGEGMGSSLVTPGTASAFGGVSPRLRDYYGIPVACCDDGPSGMRLDCGMKAFSLPNGTSIASTFNKSLVQELYTLTGHEMHATNVENLLGPGLNIHRHPLNGRNFEYFSEDPYVTGVIGSAMVQGLQAAGVTGTIKHFCGNNQEANRHGIDSIISERALREIYLKGFEIVVHNGGDSVMTTYGIVNGIHTSSSYDLNTTILRDDWGFKGIVMTDWWALLNEPGETPNRTNFAVMLRAQNDIYMCCPDGKTDASGENTFKALADGTLTRAELQRTAINVCEHVMHTQAMKRLLGTDEGVEVINRPVSPDDINMEDVEFTELGKDELVIDLSYKESKANTNFVLALDVKEFGAFEASLTASSELGELAQLPVTMFFQGIPMAGFTFNGSGGKDVTITKEIPLVTRFSICRLFVATNGLKLKQIKIKFKSKDCKSLFDM
ncbi:MAG: glycoside hydrolase family 3 protein [Treponema sp.]|nr:glycoside hydrolase family 3 protein [Treponema sp.]